MLKCADGASPVVMRINLHSHSLSCDIASPSLVIVGARNLQHCLDDVVLVQESQEAAKRVARGLQGDVRQRGSRATLERRPRPDVFAPAPPPAASTSPSGRLRSAASPRAWRVGSARPYKRPRKPRWPLGAQPALAEAPQERRRGTARRSPARRAEFQSMSVAAQ